MESILFVQAAVWETWGHDNWYMYLLGNFPGFP